MMLDNGYFRAKVAQEKLIETSGIPYTIIRSTQFQSRNRKKHFLRGKTMKLRCAILGP